MFERQQETRPWASGATIRVLRAPHGWLFMIDATIAQWPQTTKLTTEIFDRYFGVILRDLRRFVSRRSRFGKAIGHRYFLLHLFPPLN